MTGAPLDFERCYRAVASRDARFDGWFITAVRTTGIYCRPSCPTPVRPKRENVSFYPTAAAAQLAGYRACKRCRPDASPGSPEWNVRGDLDSLGAVLRPVRWAALVYNVSNSVRPVTNFDLLGRPLGVQEGIGEDYGLRLFLADALSGEDQLALVRRLRARAQTATVHMRSEIVPLAEALEESGTRYPAIVARLGADTYAYAERWLARLEAELGDERLND